MMIEKKIKKYLLNQPEIKYFKQNESGSEYFKVGESLIRLSNHVAIKNNQPDTLNIVVTGENFVVMYGNRLINVNDYAGFKNFLKYHIQMCDCFKDMIHKGLGYEPAKKTSTANTESTSRIPYQDSKITVTENVLKIFGSTYNITSLKPGQKESLITQHLNGFLKSESHVINLIEGYKRQNRR